VAWFCLGLEATLRSPHLAWAGRAAPLLGGMAVAELCRALGAVHPGYGYRVAGSALVAVIAAVAMYVALAELCRTALRQAEPPQRLGRDDTCAGLATRAVIPGRRAGDPREAVIEHRRAAQPSATPLDHLVIRGQHEEPTDVELQPLLRQVAEREVPGLHVVLEGCGVRAHGRRDDLATVFGHLLRNAREHAGSGVVVTAHAVGERIDVQVADRGPGMSLAQVATVFQRGARGPRSHGSGLGLHVAQALMRQQGGDLRLRSHVGGCVFTVTLWAVGGPTPAPVPLQRRSRRAWARPSLTPGPGE
jgi:signal transduction histidine kinase